MIYLEEGTAEDCPKFKRLSRQSRKRVFEKNQSLEGLQSKLAVDARRTLLNGFTWVCQTGSSSNKQTKD
jgi:hypothetical protein